MKWIKPSGLEININDNLETIKYAESLGWKRAGKAPAKKAVRKVPAKKAK